MAYKFKRENKYLVLKWEDIETVIGKNTWWRQNFDLTLEMIAQYRKGRNKKDNTYVVVNEDEPYAEQVWELIKQEEERKAG